MAKTKQKNKIQVRDLVIAGLVFAVVATNWVWYQHYQSQSLTNKAFVTDFLAHQIEINKLQACINEGTKPCDITPHTQQ
mgnify:FL=1